MTGVRKLSIEIAGDAKGVGKAFSDAEGKADGFGKKMDGASQGISKAWAGIAVGVGVAGAVMFDAFKDAAADESEQAIFDKQVLLAGGSKQVIDGFNAQIEAGGKLKGFTDTELRKAYAQTYSQSKDVAQSQEDVALAMDLARKAGVPLEAAVDAISKAHNGNTKALKTMLPEFGALIDGAGSSAEALDGVRDASKGMADTFAGSTQGKLARVKIQFGEMKESVGAALLPAFSAIMPVISQVTTWLGEHLPAAIEKLKGWISGATEWMGAHKAVMIVVAAVIGGLLVSAFVAWAVAAGTAAIATLAAAAPVIAIGAAIGLLAAGIIYAYEHFEVFRNVIDAVKGFIVDDLVPAFKKIWGFISDNIIPIIKTVVEVWIAALILQFKAVKAVITDVVIPAFQAVWNFISGTVIPIFQAITDKIIDVAKWVGEKIGAIVGFVTDIPGKIGAVISTLWNGLTGGITTAKDWVGERITDIVNYVINLPGRFASNVSNIFDGIKTAMTSAKDWVSDRITDVVDLAVGLPGKMVGVFKGMWDGIKDAFKGIINAIVGFWNKIEFKLPTLEIYNPFGDNWKVGGQTFGLPDIPLMLHQGGVVPGRSGQDIPALLRAGEGVFTPEQMAALGGGGSVTSIDVTVHIAGSVTTERDLIRAVYDGILDGQHRGELVLAPV